jgi:hypothetical protein
VGSIQIKVVELLHAGVAKIDMHNRLIIRGVQILRGGTQHKQSIHRLGVPSLKYIGKKPEAKMGKQK